MNDSLRDPNTGLLYGADNPFPVTQLDGSGVALPVPPDLGRYQFAAASAAAMGADAIKGEIIDILQNTIGSFELELPFLTADNAGYLANTKTFANATTTFYNGKSIADAVAFIFPADQTGNILCNTGVTNGVPITLRTQTLGNMFPIGKVA